MNIETIALGAAGLFALLYAIALALLVKSTPGRMIPPPQESGQTESISSEKSFAEVVRPVMKWLAKNRHPHTTIIIDSTHAEMVEGVECVLSESNHET